jgi:MFS family permease
MRRSLIQARKAVLSIFFINGLILGSWIPHIPLVQEKLGIGEGLLGLALLCMALGAVVFMPLSGIWSARLGSRHVTTITAFAYCFALPLPIIAPSLITLMVGLFIFGACTGAMDVAMNAQAVAVEKRFSKPVMSSFHGFFSLGGLAGSGVGGLALANGMSSMLHASLIGGLMLMATTFTFRSFLPKESDASQDGSKFVLPRGPVLALGALAFMVLMAEGAIADWSAVYSKNILATGPGLAAAGYAAFSLMMALGRLTGDKFVANIGPVAITRITSLIAALGLSAALLIRHPAAAVIGFGFVGLGLSNLIPVIFSAAGRVPNVASSTGIAAVATAGYFGFLTGPPVIGFVAEHTSLPIALGLVVIAIFSVTVFASLTKPAEGMGATARNIGPAGT